MQTFVPYETFEESASCLDRMRLGKQRVETMQILNVLTGVRDGWKSHPAVKMWRGYEVALVEYGIIICKEWTMRGYRDSVREKIAAMDVTGPLVWPTWWSGDIHRSHQSNLLRKLPEHYAQFGWDVPDDLPYVWPQGKELG